MAKDILVNRANEIIQEILKKILEICRENIQNIRSSYTERQKKLQPEDAHLLEEEELK